jgi:hypothetical protein
MDETGRQFVLQLMQPMIREFHKILVEMRERGQTENEIATMLPLYKTSDVVEFCRRFMVAW